MKILKQIIFLGCLLFSFATHAQKIILLDSGTNTSIRGLSVVDDQTFWVSGSNGMVGYSINGGKNIRWRQIKGYEQRDFRDIEAFDSNTAIIMAVAEPAVILKTTDGGSSWREIYTDTTKGVFLDAMDFNASGDAIVVGDPVEGKEYRLKYNREKDQFIKLTPAISLHKGEAFFAASGTNVRWIPGTNEYVFVTGGLHTRFFSNKSVQEIPLIQGKESTGANSIAVWDKDNMVIVGGNFSNDKDAAGNSAITADGGKLWQRPVSAPKGYRSCVEYLSKKQLIACGTSGVDLSNDGGMNWENISKEGFHVCRKAKKGNAVFLAGGKGRIAKLEE